MTYRIKDWDQFVVNRNGELKKMPWIAVPTRHDGLAYRTLVSMPNGAAHYGCFIALVTVAAICVPRGTLVRSSGQPHTAKTLAVVTGINERAIAEAMEALVSTDVAWLVPSIPQDGAEIPQALAPHARGRQYGTERNGTERNKTFGGDAASAEPVEATAKSSPKRRHQLPADFAPDETRRRLAVELGADLAVEVVKFREYHAARGNVMVEWQLALATWIRNAVKFSSGNGAGARRGTPAPSPVAGVDRTKERLRSLNREPPATRGPESAK